jgi:hypothetical protein
VKIKDGETKGVTKMLSLVTTLGKTTTARINYFILTVFTKGHSNQTYDNKDNSQITS